jgi:hypothetical protein
VRFLLEEKWLALVVLTKRKKGLRERARGFCVDLHKESKGACVNWRGSCKDPRANSAPQKKILYQEVAPAP